MFPMKIGSVVARHLALLALLVAGVLAAAPSGAVPAFTVDINAGGSPLSLTQADFTCADHGTISSCSASGFSVGGLGFNIGFSIDTDPKLFASVDVTNSTLATQQFTATFTVFGVGTSGNTTLTTGGVSGGATDNTEPPANGATIAAPAGSSIYTALIDGGTYQTLYPAPFSFNVPAANNSDNFPDLSFGPNQPGSAITNTVGLKLDFTITPDDSASVAGTFELKPVPEPGTALLLGVGLVLMARRERRQ
jgi:hypothetical protein